ncbi:MAG TPA: extracellular solute-binding protein [Planctomycetota bacterium]|nr:extracellular solute-binding protein [Planctomycetota bacterium]
MSRGAKILLALPLLAAVVTATFFLSRRTSRGRDGEVVVYTSADSAYARPVFEAFEKRTGIKVLPVTDAEAAKTTGIYNRLIAEKGRPQADVFWNSEIGRTLLLGRQGILEPLDPPSAATLPPEFRPKDALWHGFACRVRVLIYNRNLVKAEDAPKSVLDLADPKWKGKAAIALPLFGTTATHVAALRATLGREKAGEFLRRLVANGAQVVNGNGIVADRVGDGSALVGLTDTDDAWDRRDSGKPIEMVYPDQGPGQSGALIIPNTAARIARGPHAGAAAAFLDFLCSPEAERILAEKPARHLPSSPKRGVPTADDAVALWQIRDMKVDWEKVANELEAQPAELEKIFRR